MPPAVRGPVPPRPPQQYGPPAPPVDPGVTPEMAAAAHQQALDEYNTNAQPNKKGVGVQPHEYTAGKKQQILRKLGFNVTLDGQDGPQTQTAWRAYLNGVHSGAWNSAWTANHRSHPGATPPHDPPLVVNPAVPTPPAPSVPVPARQPAAAPYNPAADPSLIDPAAYARGAANEQYNPQINELARQIADAGRQQGATQGNIKDWYTKLVGDANTQAGANTADASAILSGHDAASKGLIDALGGAASGAAEGVGTDAQIGRTALEGLGLSNSALDRNLATAYGGEGVTALQDNNRKYQGDLKSALAKKGDLLGAKGAAYNTALQTALAQRTTQEKQKLDMSIEQQLSGVQQKQAEANLAGTQLSQKIDRWRFNQGIKAANAGGTTTVPEFTQQRPGDLSKLAQNMQDGLLGPKGNLAVSPEEAYTRIGDRLRQLSYGKWDPKTDQTINKWRNRVVIDHLPQWNRTHPNEQYGFFNGKIQRTK